MSPSGRFAAKISAIPPVASLASSVYLPSADPETSTIAWLARGHHPTAVWPRRSRGGWEDDRDTPVVRRPSAVSLASAGALSLRYANTSAHPHGATQLRSRIAGFISG